MLPVSVIIPTYNRASLMEKTLHSLTQQSRTDFHTIIVDHGSTDNTEEVYQKYKDDLRLSYYKIARENYSPGVPRDFGVRKSETPMIVFLDCGTVVPSHYIEAHAAFHHDHSNYVGIGLRHGYRDQRADSQDGAIFSYEDVTALLHQKENSPADSVLEKIRTQDVRTYIDLENASMPWYFGWTTNLSLPRDAYFSAGGFDLELKGWGFEDVDLCYRLSRQGLKLSFVEDGWSIELPQPRQPNQDRLENGKNNMFHCYLKQRSLALESLLLAGGLLRKAIAAHRALPTTTEEASPNITDQIRSHFQYMQQAEEIFHYLTTIGQESIAFPALPDQMRSQFVQPTLLIGGTVREAENYDYLTLVDERHISTPSIWSCCGILIPLADQSLGTVVVSDIWKRLDWALSYPFALPRISLLEFLICEIKRTAKQVVFLDSSLASSEPQRFSENTSTSVETLKYLCHKYDLPFQIEPFSSSVCLPQGRK